MIRAMAVLAVLCLPAAPAAASGETDLLYLDSAGWLALPAEAKRASSAAFMRIFCTDPRMSAESLVSCLDEKGGPLFERALACSAKLAK